ncbi:MAG: hypothetical protein AAF423_11385, partial [Pseudomonadota bacterium]
LSLAPVAASANGFGASVGDGMFSWPAGWPNQNVVKQEKVQFGAIQTLKVFEPAKAEKPKKK